MSDDYGDLDWALGELLHLTWEAKCAGVLPHRYNPELFFDCVSYLNTLPIDLCLEAWAIFQAMEPTYVFRSWNRHANPGTH